MLEEALGAVLVVLLVLFAVSWFAAFSLIIIFHQGLNSEIFWFGAVCFLIAVVIAGVVKQ